MSREMHICHAITCDVPIPARLLFCKDHWGMVPCAEQPAVLAAYVPGQERTKETTAVYRIAAAGAVIAVAEREYRMIPPIWFRLAHRPQQKELPL